jgi:hypothetical protein
MKYVVGIFFVFAAALYGRHLWRWVQEGESDIIMSVGGDGIFGRRTKRADEPVHFWTHVAINGLIIVVLAIFGFWILFGPADF